MKQILYIGGGAVVVLLLGVALWFFFFRAPASTNTTPANSFGTVANNSTGVTSNTSSTGTNGTQAVSVAQQASQQKIFEITAGPIVGATLIQTLHPTTTLARYINQEDGHVYDLPLDVPGAVPRVVSNVTIPGGVRALWVEQGSGAVMQYLDGSTVKTVYLGFPAATTTGGATLPTKILFLPDNIEDIAASPDGKSVAYLLTTAAGSDGYIANANGTGAKKLFSLPLSQVLISWPAQGILLVTTKSAVGVPGIAFSVNTKTGVTTPLVYADGLTAIANPDFSKIIYQTTESNASTQSTYVHDIQTGTNVRLSLDPFTDQCIFSTLSIKLFFCAVPEQSVVTNFLDLWHMGSASAVDGIFAYSVSLSGTAVVVTPGSNDGGNAADIYQLIVSPDDNYLGYTAKGDRSLWGVRLSQ